MNRVIVTGASGFVGGFVLRALEGRGAAAVAAQRGTTRSGSVGRPEVHVEPGASLPSLRAALEGATAVVHLAAAVHDMRGRISPGEYLRTNRDYALRLARAAAEVGVPRFVFVSTIKVNGESTPSGEAFRESSEVAPRGAYAESKWQAEEGLRALSFERGIQTAIVRPPLVYGAGVRANFRSLMRLVRSGIPLPFAGFDNARSLVYAENLADLLARLAIEGWGTEPSRTYLVSDGEDVSTAELVRRLGCALHKHPRLFRVPDWAFRYGLRVLRRRSVVDRLAGSLRVDSGRVRRELGWTPPCSLDEGLARTAEWFLTQP
jgi:nucleoside-diphosphate-sugar epimerase